MAQVANRNELADLSDKRLSTISPGVDEDLQRRMRSLLNSRNDRMPARAPLPSPEPIKRNIPHCNSDDAANADTHLHQIQDRRHRSRRWQSEFGSSRFDGSDISSKAGSNTFTSHANIGSSRSPSRAITSDKTKLERDRDSSKVDSSSSRHIPINRPPRYSLRVIPPKHTTQDDLHVRPSLMHVPGSYKSELTSNDDTNVLEYSNTKPGMSKDRFKENIEFNDPHGIMSGPNSSATAALRQAQMQPSSNQPSTEEDVLKAKPGLESLRSRSKADAKPVAPPSRSSSLRLLETHRPLSASTESTNSRPTARGPSIEGLSSATRTQSVSSDASSMPASGSFYPSGSWPRARPQQSSLTARPSERNKSDLKQEVVPAEALRPDQVDQNSVNVEGQAFTKAIDDLEDLLTEALEIAENSKDFRPNAAKHQATTGLITVNEDLAPCSVTTSESSSLSASEDERLQIRSIVKQIKTGIRDDAAPDQSYDGVPRNNSDLRRHAAMPLREAPVHEHSVVKLVDLLPQGKTSAPLPRPSNGHDFLANDWAYNQDSARKANLESRQPPSTQAPLQETDRENIRRQYPRHHEQKPLVHSRTNSLHPKHANPSRKERSSKKVYDWSGSASDEEASLADHQHRGIIHHTVHRALSGGDEKANRPRRPDKKLPRDKTLSSIRSKEILSQPSHRRHRQMDPDEINLSNRHHFSIRERHGFSLSRSHRRKPIARDWSTPRKRFVATITCVTTALLGLSLGIYAGEVPAIQYTIGDEHHWTILGNVVFFLGLATSTILFWPLPVLHGRKPYTILALALLLPLQFPQALSVNTLRSPDDKSVRVGLLFPRALCGIVMGFANINFMATLLDLFGASLQSRNPHQEVVNEHDVRRHGGGMGAWLGIWTWCSTMSIGVGFLIGAGVISDGPNGDSGSSSVSWGFYIVIIAAAFVLLLNVLVPETRRSAYRRSMAEVRTGTEVSRRVARGEIKMHLDQTGPKVWHEELFAGYRLTLLMIKQPGFLLLSLYQGWIYGQIVLIIALLGALLSKYYLFRPQYVGLGVSIIPFGALFGVPFQVAGIFSRQRKTKQRTDSMTFEKQVTWSSHLVRRTVFTILLPLAGLGYTLSSNGTVHYMAPILFAGLVGFLSTLAIAECNGLIMETFDTSDLQPGMTGRPRKALPDEVKRKMTNFSCFPRVTAGFAIAQTFAFLIAAGATGWGGVIERHLGAQVATAVVAAILLILTLLLFGVLWRFKTVQIIPSQRFGTNVLSGPEDEWKPIIIGNPSGTTRRMSILELGNMSRWTEIRRRNKLGSVS